MTLKAILALLLCLSLQYVMAQTDEDDGVASPTEAGDDDDELLEVTGDVMSTTDDSGEDLSSTDIVSTEDGSGSGSDSDDSDISSTDSSDDSDSDDSSDISSTEDSSDDSDSTDDSSDAESVSDDDDSDDDDSSDDDSEDDDSQDDNASESEDDDESQGTVSGDEDSEEDDQDSEDDAIDDEDDTVDDDPCDDLEAEECSENYDDETGEQICALNIATNNCYEIVQSRGIYGKGNFDDGYKAAQSESNAETQQLNTVVGVMGGLIGLLLLVIVAGGYWMYTKQRTKVDMEDDSDDHYRPRGVQRIDTAEDAEPMITQ